MMTTIRTDGESVQTAVDEAGGRPIVVGVDGSAVSAHALDRARHEAELRGAPLVVVWAWSARDLPDVVDGDADAWAEDHTAVWATPAHGAPVPVTARAVRGVAGPALLTAAAGADLLVVGARGRTGRDLLRLGSVSRHVVEHATGPVMVVHGAASTPAEQAGPVVVGVDGSEPSRRALRWALAEAARRDVGVIAVHGWEAPSTTLVGPVPTSVHAAQLREDASRTLLAEELARVAELAPDVPREALPLDHHGGRAVVAAADACGASLAVVGCRGRGRSLQHLLGSVSHHVVSRSPAPAVVLR